MKIYTLGYWGRTVEEVRGIAEDRDGILIDVRLSPLSRLPQWNLYSLAFTLRERYRHISYFGNANFKAGGPFKIVDFETGKAILQDILDQHPERNPILMCACKDVHRCHRQLVSDLLSRAFGCAVEHL